MTINQKLESIKKTFQEYNLDLRRINEVIEDVAKIEQSNKELLDSNNELLECLISTQNKLNEWLERCN